jgi:hypothetical protein
MRIDIVDRYTLQLYQPYFPGNESYYGAPSSDDWWSMMEWARMNSIVCRRGRGTHLIFERKEDVTAFMLRWA